MKNREKACEAIGVKRMLAAQSRDSYSPKPPLRKKLRRVPSEFREMEVGDVRQAEVGFF